MAQGAPRDGIADAAHDAGLDERIPDDQVPAEVEKAPSVLKADVPVEAVQAEVQDRLTHRALVDALEAPEVGYEAASIDATDEAHAQFRALAKTVPALVKGGGSTLDVEHGVVRHFITVLFDYHKIGIGEGLDSYDALQAYYNLFQAYRARYSSHYDEQAWLEQLETRLRNALVKQLDDPESPTTVRVSNYTIEQLEGMIGLGQALRWEQAVPGAEACVLSKLKENMQKIFLELFPLENAMHDEPRAAIIKILKEIGERRGIPLPLEAPPSLYK